MTWFRTLFSVHANIYMDHAATAPMHLSVLRMMNRIYRYHYMNPAGWYRAATQARRVVDDARARVARLISTTSDHVVFTGGGTESNHIAIMGVLRAWQQTHPGIIPHMIVSDIEHASVLETVTALRDDGQITLSLIPVGADGIVQVDILKTLITSETILVSVMYVNNEIGAIQPVREITKLVRWYKKHNSRDRHGSYPLVHTDAIQAVNYLDINIETLGIDLMTLSGSKIYGPKSAGVLYVRDRNMVVADRFGGNQEWGLRPGTEDVAAITGMATALELVRNDYQSESERITKLRELMIAEILRTIPNTWINGSTTERIANNVHVSITGISGERLVIELDHAGIAAATRSACSLDHGEESHVIRALRNADGVASPLELIGNLRLTLGRSTTIRDVRYTVLVLRKIVARIRDFEAGMKHR